MLHAINSRKARLEKIIDGVGKQPREDLITSALFGTIEFLSPPSRGVALGALTGWHPLESQKIHFWPFFQLEAERAEPDIVLAARNGDGWDYWIVEVKWGAGLGDDQIEREIRTLQQGSCLRGEIGKKPRNVVGYTLLGAEARHHASIASIGNQVSGVQFDAIPWTKITEKLRSLTNDEGSDPGLIAWACTAATFLSGTRKGSILGKWPILDEVRYGSFGFSADRNLAITEAEHHVEPEYFNFTARSE